jgi:heat shock protein HslJ
MKTALISSLALAFIFIGCATSQHEANMPKTSLDGSWKSTTSNATIRFDQGKLSGNDGCNQFMGSYVAQEHTITVSDKMMSTMMACPEMEKAAKFKTALSFAKIYENDGKTLMLFGATGDSLLILSHLSDTVQEGLYTIKYLNNGKQAVVGVKTPISMQLSKDGKMSGNTGCNLYTTSYTIKDDQLTVGFPATTRKMCPPEMMEQEQQFVNALQKSAKISRNGEKWEIRDALGALQFSMMKE